MNELALFAGIHGIGLGLKRAFKRRGLPFRTVCYVEWDDYCIEVLKSRIRDGMLDDAPIWGDIAAFDGRPWAGCVDIITGGFPCQDLSFAGKRAGLDGERSGLFFELMRVVREVRPGIVLLENVPALLIRGFGRVAAEMAASGYDTQWDCIPAAAVGAHHRRDRVFILAYALRGRRGSAEPGEQQKKRTNIFNPSCERNVAHAAEHGREWSGVARDGRTGPENGGEVVADTEGKPGEIWLPKGKRQGRFASGSQDVSDSTGEQMGLVGFAWQRGCLEEFAGRVGTAQWTTEPDVGRVVDGVPSRVDRLRALGNAVVPQVAEYVGERLIDWLYGSENG